MEPRLKNAFHYKTFSIGLLIPTTYLLPTVSSTPLEPIKIFDCSVGPSVQLQLGWTIISEAGNDIICRYSKVLEKIVLQ